MTWANYHYPERLLDHEALARALADWPHPALAAQARAVLEKAPRKALLEAARRGCTIEHVASPARTPVPRDAVPRGGR